MTPEEKQIPQDELSKETPLNQEEQATNQDATNQDEHKNDELLKKKQGDRERVKQSTIDSWLKKEQERQDVSQAPHWVQKEISIIRKKEREEKNLTAFLDKAKNKAGLNDTEFEQEYGKKLEQEISYLKEYGIPLDEALKKAEKIVTIRHTRDKKRDSTRSTGLVSPKSGIQKQDHFKLINIKRFDKMNSEQKTKYMQESELRFGNVRFI
jgi:hypothetical protein